MPRWSQSELQSWEARHRALAEIAASEVTGIKTPERKIHDQISEECRRRGWIALHSRMDCDTGRPVGEWDYTIIADCGRVFLVEVKTATGKLTPEQAGMIRWAYNLGHTVHVVRSLQDFLSVVSGKSICEKV